MIPAGQPQRRFEPWIGRGGRGMVYRSSDETLEREVAIMPLTIEGSGDEGSRARFLIEAGEAAKLQHPNIVTVYELGEDQGVTFLGWSCAPEWTWRRCSARRRRRCGGAPRAAAAAARDAGRHRRRSGGGDLVRRLPPILDKSIATGRHRVSFRWPDGRTKQAVVDVEAGEATDVTGK